MNARRQRGAISIFAAAMLVVAVLLLALVVDVGRVIYRQQQLQGAADAAALSAVRALAAGGSSDTVVAAAQEAAARNGYGGDLGSEASAVELGRMTTSGGLRSFTAGSPYNAVRITAVQSVPRSLVAPGLFPGQVTLTASAVAEQEAIGGLRLGSLLIGLDTGRSQLLNGVLGGLLGTNVALDVVSYQGLAGANVTLGDLVDAAAGVGTVDELLQLNLGVGDWLRIIGTALQNNGSLAAVTVNNLALSADNSLQLTLGDLLAVAQGSGALGASLNVFDLLLASAEVANVGHAISIDLSSADGLLGALGSAAGVGLADLQLGLQIGEGPRIAIGPPGRDPQSGDWLTWVESGQVSATIHLSTLNLDLGLVTTAINLDLFVEAGKASAWLEAIEPATLADPVVRARVGVHTSAARLGIGTPVGGTIQPSTLLDASINLGPLHLPLTITASGDVDVAAAGDQTLIFDGPFVPTLAEPSAANTQRVGTDTGAALAGAVQDLLGETSIVVNALGIPLNLTPLLNTLNGLLSPLLDALAGDLLSPLLNTLALQVGGADVTVIYLSAGHPQLIR